MCVRLSVSMCGERIGTVSPILADSDGCPPPPPLLLHQPFSQRSPQLAGIALLSYEARDARRRLDGRVARFVLGGMAGQVGVLRLRREAMHLHPRRGGEKCTHFRLDLLE